MLDNMAEENQNSFSIVMPTCGRPNLTIRAIQSIQGQIYPNWEMIIVEDGSGSEVKAVIQNYIESQNDNRLRLIHHGVRMQRLVARNTGLRAAKNEWICHLDSDDEYSRVYLDCMDWAIKE
ncbi:MAG: glycosyltransferase, partial [Candidatus Melainabacteria bacterium]|nr:glycosyltransferase [Candidatus Melainabacteria bacterium]